MYLVTLLRHRVHIVTLWKLPILCIQSVLNIGKS